MEVGGNITIVNQSSAREVNGTALTSDNHLFKCRDKEFKLGDKTLIMGVLNVTPDSFYDGGMFNSFDAALIHTAEMIEQGADIIDVGGESTRPGSLGVSADEESQRVIPVIKEIKRRFDTVISIDTTKHEVALEALKEGASIINDISGLTFDEKIADAASEYKAGIVLGHTPARPKDMQRNTAYHSVVDDVIKSLRSSVDKATEKGIDKNSIVIDPGFGFGKTREQNLILLKHLSRFCKLGKPVLIGTSNKSFIGSTLNTGKDGRVEGTAATVAIGIMKGASIVRVHEIEHMKRVCAMVDAVLNASSG